MDHMLDKTMQKLRRILKKEPFDWAAFGNVLSGVPDINFLDEEYNDTLLSRVLKAGDYFHNGSVMPEIVRCFLRNGYNVRANGGRNGVLALRELCWTSYDEYILETAKVLLDAGSPTVAEFQDDDPGNNAYDLWEVVNIKQTGAWYVDKDYTWANIMVTYDTILTNAEEGKPYRSISCFTECIGKELTSVRVIVSDDGTIPIASEDGITTFHNSFILFFGEIPLVLRKTIDFMVDPVTVEDNLERLCNASDSFAPVIGAALKCIHYINPIMCYMDFDNGFRVLLTSLDAEPERIGAFEILKAQEADLEKLSVDSICRFNSTHYSSKDTHYEEDSLALFSEQTAYVLFSVSPDERSCHFAGIECNRKMLSDYVWQFPLERPEKIHAYHKNKKINAFRLDCGNEYLYLEAAEYIGVNISVCDDRVNPNKLPDGIYTLNGKHVEFKRFIL